MHLKETPRVKSPVTRVKLLIHRRDSILISTEAKKMCFTHLADAHPAGCQRTTQSCTCKSRLIYTLLIHDVHLYTSSQIVLIHYLWDVADTEHTEWRKTFDRKEALFGGLQYLILYSFFLALFVVKASQHVMFLILLHPPEVIVYHVTSFQMQQKCIPGKYSLWFIQTPGMPRHSRDGSYPK